MHLQHAGLPPVVLRPHRRGPHASLLAFQRHLSVLVRKLPGEIREIVLKKETRRTKAAIAAAAADVDPDMLSRLKAVRRDLAAERNVPAYVIFSDATLIDMCHLQPRNLDEMGSVNGVGPKKLKDFGAVFLEALQDVKI